MPCHPPKTNADKPWPYEEYYRGERDEENRKHGNGLIHWSGAESQEWYKGCMLRDTMHGYGDYRWRYSGANHTAVTYEGRFYNNCMHGYGSMSYPDGSVYTGLYYNNIRWGPGVVSHACLSEDVGLWYGDQLIRLAWRSEAPSIAIDMSSNQVGCNVLARHRILLTTNTKIIGETNSALELLKLYGSQPLSAAEKWPKLYANNCTDIDSQLCHVKVFDRSYYKNKITTLTEVEAVPEMGNSQDSKASDSDMKTYYAWNNNKIIINMMQHCFTHEMQRVAVGTDLTKVLVGPRRVFKPAGKHELDCRTLLMASFLGHISNVAQLINECDVIPDVTDMQGNSAMIYAACGNQPVIIHFLVEAGAEVDAYNDACCTALGITLLKFALEKRDVAYSGMLQALFPPSTAPRLPGQLPPDESVLEWKIHRDLSSAPNSSLKSPSKLQNKHIMSKKNSAKELPVVNRRKSETIPKPEAQKRESMQLSFTEEQRLYANINNEYLIRVAEEFSWPSGVNPIPYIFEVHDMNKDVQMHEEESKKQTEKSPKNKESKVMKDTVRPSRDHMFQSIEQEHFILDSKEQFKQEKLGRIMLTILQLLSEGAAPRKVRCPQPPLFIATVSGCADLIRHLVRHGADVNEVYPQAFDYTALDVAVSGPLTLDSLDVIRSLLECGARADHILKVPIPIASPVSGHVDPVEYEDEGPTLLHAVLARKLDNEADEEFRVQILKLLLDYGCNPITQYNGRSAVEVAMSKSIDLFDIFIKCPHTDLNAVINNSNQSILVKMFYLPYCRTIPLTERLQTLTNLLLFGADPLIKCQNGTEKYGNLFVYAKQVASGLEPSRPTGSAAGIRGKSEVKEKKSKKDLKPKKEDKATGRRGDTKSSGKPSDDNDYKQAVQLVVDCARLLHIRWLQATLMKELIDIVSKYKHRSWNMILKEHKNHKCAALWLTAVHCLEIWDTLKTTKKKIYNDDKILKYVLCIIHFYYKRTQCLVRWPSMSLQDKLLIELEVARFIRDHKSPTMSTPDILPHVRPYVAPELTVKEIEKFNVCFECAMPLTDVKIQCGSCKLIAFCSFKCIETNIERINCHPCSSYLKEKYFPTPEDNDGTNVDQDLI